MGPPYRDRPPEVLPRVVSCSAGRCQVSPGRSAGRLASPGILLPARAPVSRARPDPTRIPAHPPCRHDGPAPRGACATQQGPARQHARPTPRPLLPRHRHRPRHRQHARPRPRPRDRDLRAVGRRDRREDQARARDRRRGQADGRPDARLDHRGPPAARRRHQRLRRHRADDQVLREQGARPGRADPAAADAARHPVGRDRGREARRPRRRAQLRRALGAADRGADGGGDRRRAAGDASRPGRSSSTSAAARPRSP